jgi:ligand-binding sensor protein
MSELSVYDVDSRENWQKLLDGTQSSLGLPIALLDPDNVILQTSGERNELCKEIRSLKKAKPVICGQSQQFMAEMARTQNASIVDICEAGMAKFVVPVFKDENYLGCITTCGCMLPETKVEAYLIEKAAGIGENTIVEMAEDIPIVQKEQLQQVAEELFRHMNNK